MRSLRRLAWLGTLLLCACTDITSERVMSPFEGVGFAPGPGGYQLVIDEIRDLGTLPQHTWSEAHDINQNGYIVGTSQYNAKTKIGGRAVRWPGPLAAPSSLGALGPWSEGWDLNDQSVPVIVGNTGTNGSDITRGFRWSPATGMVDLGLVGLTAIGSVHVTSSFTARAVSWPGHVVGTADSQPDLGVLGAYLLEPIGAYRAVPATCLAGYLFGNANDVNDSGTHVGQVKCAMTLHEQAFVATLGSFTNLGDLADGASRSQALGINNAGTVVGWAAAFALPGTGMLRDHAFRWTPATGMKDMHPAGDTLSESAAEDVSGKDIVVGYRWPAGKASGYKAFVHGQGLGMTSLPGLCGDKGPSKAFAVNDNGWIVGGSTACSGQYHATAWKVRVVSTPLPWKSRTP